MSDYREIHCPYGDDFEGGDECDRCEQYELCIETPSADVVSREEYEKLKSTNKALQNRCKALTHGLVCLFCPIDCEYRVQSFREDAEE